MLSKRQTEQKYEDNEEDGISESNIIVFKQLFVETFLPCFQMNCTKLAMVSTSM